jgi:hypothetical protein
MGDDNSGGWRRIGSEDVDGDAVNAPPNWWLRMLGVAVVAMFAFLALDLVTGQRHVQLGRDPTRPRASATTAASAAASASVSASASASAAAAASSTAQGRH